MVSVSELPVQLVSKPGTPNTGIGRYARELERGLRARGIHTRMAGPRNPLPGIVRSLAARAGYDLHTFLQSYPLRAGALPGYVTHITSQTLASLLLTQRLPRPVVVTVHDILPYLLRRDPELNVYRNRAHRLVDMLAMRALRQADRLIADSGYTKSTLVESLGIPAGRISVVHLGVDTDRFRPRSVDRAFLDRYGLSSERRYVLFVGSEEPRKRLPALLDALALVARDCPDVELLKVGAPAFPGQRERHLRQCRSLGISGSVRWLDDVPEDDLPLLYNLASVLAFPSRHEGFGLPVLEALACGTPAVAARAGPIPETAGDVATLIDDLTPESLSAAIVGAMRGSRDGVSQRTQHARRFRWEDTVEKSIDVYRRADRKRQLARPRGALAPGRSGPDVEVTR